MHRKVSPILPPALVGEMFITLNFFVRGYGGLYRIGKNIFHEFFLQYKVHIMHVCIIIQVMHIIVILWYYSFYDNFAEPAVIAKSNIILDVKPWDDETGQQHLWLTVLCMLMDVTQHAITTVTIHDVHVYDLN